MATPTPEGARRRSADSEADGTEQAGPVLQVESLLRRPGSRKVLPVSFDRPGVSTSLATVTGLSGDVVVDSLGESLTVSGRFVMGWEAECRRCLDTAMGTTEFDLQEVFERQPAEGDAYLLPDDDVVDFGPMLREQMLLSLPVAPLCAEDCAGPVPEAFDSDDAPGDDAASGGDPRWAALGSLVFDEDGPE